MAAEQKPVPHAFRQDVQDFESTPRTADFSYGAPKAAGVELAAQAEREPHGPRPVAMLVCHGMGQQVRFETLGQIGASILTQAQSAGCTIYPNGVELSYQDESFLGHAKLRWTDAKGEAHEVHLYEAYWAPVTEGKVTYADTVKFLLQAAWRGLRCSRFFRPSSFERWMFDDMRKMTISAGTKLALIVVAAFLLLEVGTIAFVTLRVAAGVKEVSAITAWPAIPPLPHTFSLWLALKWIWCFLAFLGNNVLQLLKPFVPQHSALHHWPVTRHWWKAALSTLIWLALVAQAFFVRYFLIEYAGDVAAYISPFKDSKFDAIRTEIQTIGLRVAKAIYGFNNPGIPPVYERIVIVGHSLGSVLAYDTLNAVINLDSASAAPGSQEVVRRTTHLVTFGSPLDKTAFLFRTQSNHVADPLREQMAAGFQPLIRSYPDFRANLKWINLWSKMDIISGELNYYDYPAHHPHRIDNRQDPAAHTPLKAHIQYWNGELLARTLYDAVC